MTTPHNTPNNKRKAITNTTNNPRTNAPNNPSKLVRHTFKVLSKKEIDNNRSKAYTPLIF